MTFMELEVSVPFQQELLTGPCPWLDESSRLSFSVYLLPFVILPPIRLRLCCLICLSRRVFGLKCELYSSVYFTFLYFLVSHFVMCFSAACSQTHVECVTEFYTTASELFVVYLAQQPPLGQGLLIHEVSRSHSTTHHSR
jgi:hypothetical protein